VMHVLSPYLDCWSPWTWPDASSPQTRCIPSTTAGKGREEFRSLKTATVAAGLVFPHAVQAIAITRRVRPLPAGRGRTVTAYGITSLTVTQASPATSPDGSAATGASRPCTKSATPTTAETPPRSAPQTAPGHGHPTQPHHRDHENGWPPQHRSRHPAPRPGRHPGPGHPRNQPSMNETDITPLCRRGASDRLCK
jgi:hypothetical protein